MRMSTGMQVGLPEQLFSDVSSYRYKVFVEQLGWELNTQNGLELDQFDCEDTYYVIAQHDTGEIAGCARLLPTTVPYLLGEIFPQLLNGLLPPQSSEVWELSRFASVDLSGQGVRGGQFSSPVAVELLKAAMACAKAQGAKRLITVSPVGVERLLQRAGFRCRRAGPPMIVGGHALTACWIDLDNDDDVDNEN
jgi:acyl homoserine lactone synthase